MRLTVLGGCGAWPAAGSACGGYLVEHDGFRLLIDPGYATTPRLLARWAAGDVDAVLVSHGHPDHCADLNPLLRARAFTEEPVPDALPVWAPPGALDAVLALDRPGALDDAYRLHEFVPGAGFALGPFRVDTRALPHFVPNAGMRLTASGQVLAYTGDTGPSKDIVPLAWGADLLLAEATYVERVPERSRLYLSSARQAGGWARRAGAARLMLTHQWPGSDPDDGIGAAAGQYDGAVSAVTVGATVDLSG